VTAAGKDRPDAGCAAATLPAVSTSEPSLRLLDVLATDPARAGLFSDFDGTLSAIVDRPEDAAPLPGVVEVLDRLAGSLGRVAILSGRPVAFVGRFFPPSVAVAGLYGLEQRIGGEIRDHPMAGAWREVVADVVASAVSGPAGMRIESKGLSLTLHYRGRPELAGPVEAWARGQATRSGLELRAAKMSFELHPPIAADKGTVLAELAQDLSAVAFIGDDVGDLDAFDALDRLDTAGVHTVRVGVRGPEQAAAVVDRADLALDGPEGVLVALQGLADRLP
jgi:trehalose 6-phosphate phosphatase